MEANYPYSISALLLENTSPRYAYGCNFMLWHWLTSSHPHLPPWRVGKCSALYTGIINLKPGRVVLRTFMYLLSSDFPEPSTLIGRFPSRYSALIGWQTYEDTIEGGIKLLTLKPALLCHKDIMIPPLEQILSLHVRVSLSESSLTPDIPVVPCMQLSGLSTDHLLELNNLQTMEWLMCSVWLTKHSTCSIV